MLGVAFESDTLTRASQEAWDVKSGETKMTVQGIESAQLSVTKRAGVLEERMDDS